MNLGNYFRDKALVFYNCEKYLYKNAGRPLIDQHLIRAFSIYMAILKSEDNETISKLRELKSLKKSHKEYIREYKKWLISDNLK